MVSSAGFTRLGKLYLWSVILAGSLVVGASLYQLSAAPIGYQWFVLAALTLVSGSATVKLPSSYASISVSETFVFTAVLLYGPAAGTIIVALDALVISFWISKRHDGAHRALFNVSAPALSAWCSSHLFFRVAHVVPLVQAPAPLNAILPALVVFALTYFGLNSWLITFIIALERRVDPLKVWSSTFVWLSLNYFGGASVAILFVGYNRTIDLGYVGVIVPLLLVLWFTFRTAMGRVEDADRHVEQLNKLYLSTIETLAMAIDAKDQVTHGHIRRVQSYATSLAAAVGIRNQKLLKAIEAAALLHDMGKLAVPEYILNKPGKLTTAEFEKMKLHASVGAEILSAIDFPYPVVPIVRHHHENWNGTGYPDGLRGTDIPIGARILSVVDCFDALTSDRPYRPRLTDAEALQILNERRGTMYDPLVVDTFARVHEKIVHEPAQSRLPSSALNEIAAARKSVLAGAESMTRERTTQREDTFANHRLAPTEAPTSALPAGAETLIANLQQVVSSSICILFLYDDERAEIEAAYVLGDGASSFKGLRIQLGQRLSGWVAANRQPIVNSDPTLDLGEIQQIDRHKRLKSCISVPVIAGSDLVGVISMYSELSSAFDDEHRNAIEAVAAQMALITHRTSHERSPQHGLAELPNLEQLESLLSTDLAVPGRFALLIIRIINYARIRSTYGDTVSNEVLRQVARRAGEVLQPGDIIFGATQEDLVAFIPESESQAPSVLARRLMDVITSRPVVIPSWGVVKVEAEIFPVGRLARGVSVSTLIATHRRASTARQSYSADSSIH